MVGVHERVQKALDKIIEDADEQGLETIIFCTHAATNIALGRALTHDPEVHQQARRDADVEEGSSNWHCFVGRVYSRLG
jgi:broad specificity phosphatase PhoE